MKSKIGTYSIAFSLILSVLLSSCSSPYRIMDSFHDGIHSISALFSGEHSHDHSHELLDLLEHQHNDAQHNKYVLDNNNAKILNELYVFDSEYNESNFHRVSSLVEGMIDSYNPVEMDRPPIF